LYHLKLEDKVVSWLPEVWRNATDLRGRSRTRQFGPLYHLPSSLSLLETVCGLQHRCLLLEVTILPDCAVVDTLEQYDNTAVIRDFLLHAHLPDLSESQVQASAGGASVNVPTTDSFMVASSGRERRTTALLLKIIEAASEELDEGRETKSILLAEEGQKYISLAVVVMAFSANLLNNGVRANRRMFQLACRILSRVVQSMTTSHWSADEKASAISVLAPLILTHDDDKMVPWESIVLPSVGTGIKREALTQLLPRLHQVRRNDAGGWRRHLWQDTDVSSKEAYTYVTDPASRCRQVSHPYLNS
jgi:serine-protein kinase ATM